MPAGSNQFQPDSNEFQSGCMDTDTGLGGSMGLNPRAGSKKPTPRPRWRDPQG
ncbi:hypothetical protein [Spirosoma pollinicola]|uniref:hypothetical protein n=1 Tax=Spirosoma pollinicola TaxID=2057025 RepID=UPI0012FE2236|nr:hypothetical protein [Spirosoma pollinicola]